MMALFFRGEVDEAERVGELALAASPHDSELLSEFGTRVAMAGEWQRGRELVERALARNPGYSGYYHAALALIAYMQRDLDRAETEIRQANLAQVLRSTTRWRRSSTPSAGSRPRPAERPPGSRSSTPCSSRTWTRS